MPRTLWLLGALLLLFSTAGCGSPASIVGEAAGGVVLATYLGAQAPSHELEQIYYLGVFDPQSQVPEAVYRITVRGQSSFISSMRFGSGWLPAVVADSLSTQVTFKSGQDNAEITRGDDQNLAALQTGRRLMMFGPEGFREAPKDHRLAIVMGASPQKFFEAIDQVLGEVSGEINSQRYSEVKTELLKAPVNLKSERERLEDPKKDVAEGMSSGSRDGGR